MFTLFGPGPDSLSMRVGFSITVTVIINSCCSQRIVPCPVKDPRPHLHLSEGWQIKGPLVAVYRPLGMGSPKPLAAARSSLRQAHRFGEYFKTRSPPPPQIPCSPGSREGSVAVRRRSGNQIEVPPRAL